MTFQNEIHPKRTSTHMHACAHTCTHWHTFLHSLNASYNRYGNKDPINKAYKQILVRMF